MFYCYRASNQVTVEAYRAKLEVAECELKNCKAARENLERRYVISINQQVYMHILPKVYRYILYIHTKVTWSHIYACSSVCIKSNAIT